MLTSPASKFEKGCKKACEDTGSGTSLCAPRKSSSQTTRPRFFKGSLEELREMKERREKEETQARSKAKAKGDATPEPGPDPTASISVAGIVGVQACKEAAILNGKTEVEKQYEGEKSLSKASQPSARSTISEFSTPSTVPTILTSPSTSQSLPQPSFEGSPQANFKLKDNFHIYLDPSGFEYNCTLVRTNLFRNSHTRYVLRLFESNTKPHSYCTVVRYAPPPPLPTQTLQTNKLGIPILTSAEKHSMSVARASNSTPTSAPNPPTNGPASENRVKPELPSMEKTTDPSPPTPFPYPNLCPPQQDPRMISALNVIQKPPRSSDAPLSELLAPINSTFETSFAAFRTAFNELTFLAWEDRLHPAARELQKRKAKTYGLEPFTYCKPQRGLPLGMMPQLPINYAPALNAADGDEKAKYVSTLGLPGMDAPLTKEGLVGGQIIREAEEARRRKEEAEELERVRMEREKRRKSGVRPKAKPDKKLNPNALLLNKARGVGISGNAGGYGRAR